MFFLPLRGTGLSYGVTLLSPYMTCHVITYSSRSRLSICTVTAAVAPQGSSPSDQTPTSYPYRKSLRWHHSQSYSCTIQLVVVVRCPLPRRMYKQHHWQQGHCCLTCAELRKQRRGQRQLQTGLSCSSTSVTGLTSWCSGSQLSR